MPKTRGYQFDLRSVPLTAENLLGYDLVIIATDHSCLDYEHIITHSHLVVDTRNAIAGGNHHHKLIRA